jgi:hypothetical protein
VRVRYTRQAHADIAAISAYLADRSPAAAKSVKLSKPGLRLWPIFPSSHRKPTKSGRMN